MVISLVNNPEKRREIGTSSYETIANLWSEKIAAERFCAWAKDIVKDKIVLFPEGPMSKAKIRVPKGSWWIK